MRLHTTLTGLAVRECLFRAQVRNGVARDVGFEAITVHGSRSRDHAFEVQLGTWDKTSGPTKSRHFKNSGVNGASHVYAASYDEWGWFIARVFQADPTAIFGPYNGLEDFNVKTKNAYTLAPLFETV